MTVVQGRTRTEVFFFGVVTLCMTGGVGLCMSGLLVPNWVFVTWNENIVIVNARVGLWQDQLCDYEGCRKYWNTHCDYDPHPQATFTSRDAVRGLETSGTVISVLAFLSLIPLWKARYHSKWVRVGVHLGFFSQSIIAAILCIAGCLVLSTHVESGSLDWAPFLSGSGGALLLIAAVLSGIPYLRYQLSPNGPKVYPPNTGQFSSPQVMEEKDPKSQEP